MATCPSGVPTSDKCTENGAALFGRVSYAELSNETKCGYVEAAGQRNSPSACTPSSFMRYHDASYSEAGYARKVSRRAPEL